MDKHGVLQSDAARIFFNTPLLIVEDMKYSKDEPRFHALGRTTPGRLLHVTFTTRAAGTKIRVISARDMNRKEKALYEETSESDTEVQD